MFFDKFFDQQEPSTPEQLERDLKVFEKSVREIEKDFPELMLARKVAKQRWLIERHESRHSIH